MHVSHAHFHTAFLFLCSTELIAEACDTVWSVVKNYSKLGKLRSMLWCREISADFSSAANNLSAAIKSFLRRAPKVI